LSLKLLVIRPLAVAQGRPARSTLSVQAGNGSEAVKKLKNSLNRKKSLLIIKNLLRRFSAIFNFFTDSQ